MIVDGECKDHRPGDCPYCARPAERPSVADMLVATASDRLADALNELELTLGLRLVAGQAVARPEGSVRYVYADRSPAPGLGGWRARP